MTDSDALQDAVDTVRRHFGAVQAILVLKDPGGFNAMASSCIPSHHDAVLLLASATHMILMGHDEAVLAGAAGDDAQRVAEELACS